VQDKHDIASGFSRGARCHPVSPVGAARIKTPPENLDGPELIYLTIEQRQESNQYKQLEKNL
jgi:hypothetical protein